jgi:cob(I)alamin adenosyltransferase
MLSACRRAPVRAALGAAARRDFKVYTRNGDKGVSSLFNGERRPKSDLTFEALGNTDELNAAVGLAAAHCQALDASGADLQAALLPQLQAVQSCLLDIGSAVATPRSQSSDAQLARARFDAADDATASLERWIDTMDESLPELRNFILPGGGTVGSSLHLARAICRRTERSVVPLVDAGECDAGVVVYVNRLSDYLFVAARYAALLTKCEETSYRKPKAAAAAAADRDAAEG